jgi:predicted DNA-binding protein
MSPNARLSIRLDPELKQRLVAYSQATGIRISQVVAQALEVHLSNGVADPLEQLRQRVEKLEIQIQALQPQPSGLPSATPQAFNGEESPLLQTEPDPIWDPLESSFEDWVYQTWQRLASAQASEGEIWGYPIPVEALHETGFVGMRFRLFIDRLLQAETPGLQLLPDETSRLGLGDCRPGEVTFTMDPASIPEQGEGEALGDLPLNLGSSGNGTEVMNGWKPFEMDG